LLIIGVDPGTTTALAGINVFGELVFLWSKKNAKEEEILKEIIKAGTPLIFVSDKRKVPSLIEKLSDRFLVDYFVPKKDLSLKLKRDLVKEYLGKNIKNPHILDALASALYYYKINKNRIDYLINKFGEKSFDLLKYGYIKEKNEKEIKKIEKIAKQKPEKFEEILKLKKELFLKDLFIKKLKRKVWQLKSKLKKIKEETINKERKKYKNEILRLKKENNELKNIVNQFSDLIEKLLEKEYTILYDWKLKRYSKPSFISNKELLEAKKEELEKFEKLVKESDLSHYVKIKNYIIAPKNEVEKALLPKEDEIKKALEYLKIYKELRKKNFY
jgi:predicted RNase H-like nuclease (RuvC/YqgF family)